MTSPAFAVAVLLVLVSAVRVSAAPPEPTREPVRRTLDLAVGETAEVVLADGSKAAVRLLAIEHDMDGFDSAVRQARARVEVNGQAVTLTSGNYRLPVTAGGARIDCPITRAYYATTNEDRWGLAKDARLRLWPARGPYEAAGTFGFPARMRLFASDTQMANEPVFVDAGERGKKKIYYHSGLDFGGAEGLVDVLAATDGRVVSAGTDRLPGYEDTPVSPRYDVLYVLDDRGWYYRYSHLKSFAADLRPGVTVRKGQVLGLLGKEGGSGGWSHLHFEIRARQPSGLWGAEEAYPFCWEAYVAECRPPVIALARPHVFAPVGEAVTLDASRCEAFGAAIDRYEWALTDGTRAVGPTFRHTYDQPGTYSERVRVTDARGAAAYDFCVVQIAPKDLADLPPTVHAVCEPTRGVRPGDPVTFKVRSFRTKTPGETWDFGDGSPRVQVKSDGNANVHDPNGYAVCVHRYEKPGDYIATVEHVGANGWKAVGRVWVAVGP